MGRRLASRANCKHFRAVLVRVVFLLHALWAVYLCTVVTIDPHWWYFSTSSIMLLAEAIITLRVHHGQEYKYFCPSIFFYCVCMFPPIWVMELHVNVHNESYADDVAHPMPCFGATADTDLTVWKAQRLNATSNATTAQPTTQSLLLLTTTETPQTTEQTIVIDELYIAGLRDDDSLERKRRSILAAVFPAIQNATIAKLLPPCPTEHSDSVIPFSLFAWLHFEFRRYATFYLQCTVQLLLLLVIVGRWALPKGTLTHNQLSQLLLVYFADAADIAEFFDTLNDKSVARSEVMCMIVLACWSVSVIRFSIVIAEKDIRDRRQSRPSVAAYFSPVFQSNSRRLPACFDYLTMEVVGIGTNMLMQNAPYLGVRLYVISEYQIVNYTNLFFAAKNMITIVLMFYRLAAIFHRIAAEKLAEQALSMEPAIQSATDLISVPMGETGDRRRKIWLSPPGSDDCNANELNEHSYDNNNADLTEEHTLELHQARPPADMVVNLQCGTATLPIVSANESSPPYYLKNDIIDVNHS